MMVGSLYITWIEDHGDFRRTLTSAPQNARALKFVAASGQPPVDRILSLMFEIDEHSAFLLGLIPIMIEDRGLAKFRSVRSGLGRVLLP